jgi:hypothetical protein
MLTLGADPVHCVQKVDSLPAGDETTNSVCLVAESSESSAASGIFLGGASSCNSYSFCKILSTRRSGPVSSASGGKGSWPMIDRLTRLDRWLVIAPVLH